MGSTSVISHTQGMLDRLEQIIKKKQAKMGLNKPITVGFLSGSMHPSAKDSNNKPIKNAQLAYMLNYGYTFVDKGHTVIVPARPFLARTIAGIKNIALTGNITATSIAKNLKGLFIYHLTSGDYVPNAFRTIKKKGFDYPLLEKGDLSRAVEYKIGKI